MAICTSWCQWYEEVVHGSIGCRASNAIYLGLYFHCASHAACTHTPFQRIATALAIGFSSERVLKCERLKHKKETWVLGGVKWFFLNFFIERQFFPNERRREARVHEVTRLISVVPHWQARIRLFFYFLVLFFEPSCWWQCFCSFFLTYLYIQ